MTKNESFGIWQLVPCPVVTSVLLSRDLEFVIVDFEHGGFDISTLVHAVFAAKALNKRIYARVPSSTSSLVPQILDANVDGILFAHINNKSDAINAAKAINFPPEGTRSYTPFSYAFSYNLPSQVLPQQRLGILLESLEGVSQLSDMLESVRVDFVYFGAYDLSAEIGRSGDIFCSEVMAILKRVAAECVQKNIPLWALAKKPGDILMLKSIGVNVIVLGVDTGLIADAATIPHSQ